MTLDSRLKERQELVYQDRIASYARRTDELFTTLFVFQWLAGLLFTLLNNPFSWEGDTAKIHIHVYLALLLGGMLASVPIYFNQYYPGSLISRLANTTAQMFFAVLLIHLSGGRIETHFHIFVSLAFLSAYRDPRPIYLAAAITFGDHLIRGAFWPLSVYGTLSASPARAIEHAGWVVFEVIVLRYIILLSQAELRSVSQSQIELEQANVALKDANNAIAELNSRLEQKTLERARQLFDSQKIVQQQQESLVATSKMSALGEMAGGIAHEINNPLGIIQGKSLLLLKHAERGTLTTEKGREELQKIVSMTDRIARTIKGLRTFSRNGAKDPFAATPVASLIQNTVDICQERMALCGIRLDIGEIPNVSIDCRSVQIEQVLINLLNNARDAVSDRDDRWIKVQFCLLGNRIQISVVDSGPGIPAAVRTKLMQPFFTTKASGHGTGLGLSISRSIISDHNGELRYDAESKNTRFVIDLPLTQAKRIAPGA